MKDGNIPDVLTGFKPISLQEIENILLFRRIETKFIFSAILLRDFLKKAVNHYHVLEINAQHNSVYRNTYLDTSDYQLFHNNLSGKLNSQKVRYRIYESTGMSYLEVKTKSNKMCTHKSRIKNELIDCNPDDKALAFLSNHIPFSTSALKPVLVNKFNRITLVNLGTKERVTVDYNLSFSDLNGKSISLPYLAVAELKRETILNQSPLLQIAKALNIRPVGFSKYCIGCVLIYNMPRYNILKPKLLTLEKIKNDYYIRTNA